MTDFLLSLFWSNIIPKALCRNRPSISQEAVHPVKKRIAELRSFIKDILMARASPGVQAIVEKGRDRESKSSCINYPFGRPYENQIETFKVI
jgi:hypothetical protein